MNSYSHKQSTKTSKKHDQSENCKVYLGNLDQAWSEKDINLVMSKFGKIANTTIVRSNAGCSKGYGLVTFVNQESAKSSCGQVSIKERMIEVRPSIKNSANLKTPNGKKSTRVPHYQKENNFPTANSFAEDTVCTSSKLVSVSSIKLSKHSKQFTTTNCEASTSGASGSEIKDLTVNVINLSSSTEYPIGTRNSERSQAETLNLEKSGARPKVISKLSKEFHPTAQAPLAVAVTAQASPALDYYGSMLALCSPLRPMSVDAAAKSRVDPDRSLRIAFFTFPGRD